MIGKLVTYSLHVRAEVKKTNRNLRKSLSVSYIDVESE